MARVRAERGFRPLEFTRKSQPKGSCAFSLHRDGGPPRQVRGPHLDEQHVLFAPGLEGGTQDSPPSPALSSPEKGRLRGRTLQEIDSIEDANVKRCWPPVHEQHGANFSSPFCTGAREGPPAITGPKYFVPDIDYAPSDVDAADIVPFREEDFEETPLCHEFEEAWGTANTPPSWGVKMCSWNLAGTSEKRVKSLISHIPCCDILAVQEFPKQQCKWQVLKGEVFHAVIFQHVLMYRSIGIFYKCSTFHLIRKVAVHPPPKQRAP